MSTIRKVVDDIDDDAADVFAFPATVYSLRVRNHGDEDIKVYLYDALAEDITTPDVTVAVQAHRTIVNAEHNPSYPLGVFSTAVSASVTVGDPDDPAPEVLPVLEFEAVITDAQSALTGTATVLLGDDSVEVQHPLVTTSSIILATSLKADATGKNVVNVVPAAGSFTINVAGTATANMPVGYSIVA